MVTFIFLFLLIAGAIGYFTRTKADQRAEPGLVGGYGPGGGDWRGSDSGSELASDLADAEAEAKHWVERLGAGISQLDGAGDRAATQSLSEAAERHTSGRRQLAQARTARQFVLAGHTALEGLHYLRAARTALGLDPGPEFRPVFDRGFDDSGHNPAARVPTVQGTRRVVVDNREYEASAQPGERTPYYYPGGTVQGRPVPAGWYNTPWWKAALVAGAAGVGSLLVMDALFGGMHHGGMGHGFEHVGGRMGGGFDGGLGGGMGGGFDGGMGGFF